MNMSVLERILALSVLPKESDYATLKILTNLRLSLAFSEDEIKTWGITTDPVTGTTKWQQDGVRDIPIGEKATDIIVESLRRLSREKKLKIEAMSLYEKFIHTSE